MSIEKLKGLKGLKGLSAQEYEDWRNQQIEAGKIKETTSFENQEKVYNNQLYIAKYGRDSFKSFSYDERLARYREDTLKDAVLDKYAGDPKLSEYMSFSTEGMEDLMFGFEEDGKTYNHLNLYNAEERRESRRYDESKGMSVRQKELANKHMFVAPGAIRTPQQLAYQGEVDARETKESINNSVYELIKARENDRLQERAKPRALEIQQEMLDAYDSGDLSYDDINDEFATVTKNSNYYKAFEDAKELEGYTAEQKIAEIAYYRAITEESNTNKADSVADQRMRDYISDKQNGWDWAVGTITNIGVGGVAHLANTGLGYYAMLAALGSDEDLNLFLQGKRKDGSNLPNWVNPQYWNGVDQFNTLSSAEINRARENGGISKFNNITRSGEDLDFWNWNTLNEGFKMGKYMWSNALLAYIGGVGSNALAKGFGATFTKSIWNPTTMLAQGVTGKAATAHTVGNVLNTLNTSVPMAFSMGANKYNDVKTSAYERIDAQVDKAYQDVLRNTSLSNEEISALVERHLTHPKIVEEIENRVQELKQSTEYNERGIRPSEESLKELVTQQIRTSLWQNPMSLYEYYNGNAIKQTIRDSYNNDYHNAELAATKAFQVQATISGIKESITNQMLRGYLFSKGNRLKIGDDVVDNIGVGADGYFQNLFKPRPLLTLGKQAGGEFIDEWFDAHSEHFSEGFGLGWFNNVTQARYNPEFFVRSQGFMANFLSGIDEGWKQLGEQFWDKAGIYEGLIGAISPFTSIAPNIGGIIGSIQSRINSKENQEVPMPNMHWTAKISQYITNPLISSIAEEYEKTREVEEEVEIRNAILKANADAFLDISEMIASFDESENAVLSHDLRKAKNAKLTKAFNTIWALKTMSEDELYGKSSIVQNALNTIQAYANGEVDEDAITQFLGQAENKKYADDPNGRQLAKDLIIKNAKELLKYQEDINTYEKMLDETAAGKKLNPITKKQLIFSKLFDVNMEERLNALEREISGGTTYSTRTNFNAEFSSEEGFEAVRRVTQEEIEELEEKIEEVEDTLKENPKDEAAKLAKASLVEKLSDARTRYRELKEHKEKGATIISKEEILRLSPIQREKILNPDNIKLYSEEQQKIIKETLSELRLKDPNIFTKLQDAAVLQARREANRKAFIRIQDNQELYDNYVKEESLKLFDRSARVIRRMAINEVASSLEGLSIEDAKAVIMSRGYSSGLMKAFVKDRYEDEHPYDNIISLIELQESANTIINKEFGGDKVLKSIVAQITAQASSVSNTMTLLEKFVDVTTDSTAKEKLEKLLVELEQIGHQRDATVINDRAERKKREEKLEEQRKAEEKAKKEALKKENSKFELDEDNLEDVSITLNDEGEPISPSIKEQSKNDKASNPQQVIPDTTDEGNTLQEGNDIFNGLIFPEFNNDAVIHDGYLVPERELEHTGIKTSFYKFLDDRDIDLQDIVDFELSTILKENPDVEVHFMMVKQNENAADVPFLVIEYTEDVKKHHKTERNGVIPSGGKEWLIIGHAYASTQEYIDFLNILKRKRFGYFNYNPKEIYYVSDSYTKINQIGSGRRVRRLQGDEETKQRKISELLYDENGEYNEERNPHHLGDSSDKASGYTNLSWYIQKSEQYIPVNTGDNEVIPLSTPNDNVGAVFLLVPAANGKLLPLYVNPSFYQDVIKSRFGDEIKAALSKLTSPDLEIRKKTKDQIRQYLVLTEEDDILIGNDKHPTISIKKGGVITRTYTLDGTFSLQTFLSDVEALNPRINITVSVLQDATMMEMYDEAGALTLDVAMLGTRNGSFTTYAVSPEGKPIITETPTETTPARSSNSTKQRRVAYNGQQYSLVDGKWFDANDNVVTDNELIKKIEYQQVIFNRTPDYKAKNGDSYYILDTNNDNPVVFKQTGKEIVVANKEQALAMINLVNKIKEAEALAASAAAEFVDLGIEESDEKPVVDPAAQMLGDFGAPQQTTNPPVTEEVKSTKENTKPNEEKTLKDLVSTEDLTTFAELISKTSVRTRLKKIFREKGWTYTNNAVDMVNFLVSKKIPVTSITDVDTWLDIIKNCR